jgi:hypothetical protein
MEAHPVPPRAACALALTLLVACRPASRDAPPSNRSDAEPERGVLAGAVIGLAEGITWTFRGHRRWFDHDTGADVETPVTWTTTIVAERSVDRRAVYRIRGWPGAALDDAGRETALSISEGIVYFGDADRPAAADGWLRLPPRDGDVLCDEPDGYCWSVEARGRGFDVILRTRPDVTIYHLEPGRGLTRFEYHHNGTTESVVLERIE